MIRAAAVALAFALLAAGCGGGTSHRGLVTTYIDQVDTIEAKLAAPLLAISKANRDFARHKGKPAAVATRLRRAAGRVDALGRRLAAVAAPPEAARLKPLLVALAFREASLAREVASLATFLPAFGVALQPLGPAAKQLKQVLKSKAKAQVKAGALEIYAAAVDGVIGGLGALHPPPVSAAAYNNQLATLGQVRDSARALAQGLRNKRAKDLATLLRRFNQAAVGNQSTAAQQAQIAAVRAYDNRITGLGRLELRIHLQQIQLAKLK